MKMIVTSRVFFAATVLVFSFFAEALSLKTAGRLKGAHDVAASDIETVDQIEQDAANEEAKDDAELEKESEGQPGGSEQHSQPAKQDDSSHQKSHASIEKGESSISRPKGKEGNESKADDKTAPGGSYADYTTTPPSEPFAYMYAEADAVARDAELRRGADFHPQGTKPALDKSNRQQFMTDVFFSQDPSIFGHCVLIRDFAEPLRVGSAIIRTQSSLRKQPVRHHPKAPTKWHANTSKATKWHANTSKAVLKRPPEGFVRAFAGGTVSHSSSDNDDKSHKGGEETLPDKVLVPKGGVIDRDVGEEIGKDGHEEDHAELEVNMFAFLRSVAGEVAVIPNGDIQKWSSKKKVPIAGYLCTTDAGPVLHTLPTPCLPTSLDSNGQAFAPPEPVTQPPPPDVPPNAPPGVSSPAGAAEKQVAQTVTGMPVASPPAAAPQTVTGLPLVNAMVSDETSDAAIEAQAEAEAASAEAIANGPESVSMLQMRGSRRAKGVPAPAPAASPAPAPLLPAKPEPFHVWVGSTLLEFRSKPKAERFCQRLTKRIAEDDGDNEWDADKIMPDTVSKRDMSVANFMALARKAAPDWTKGTKTVLVVVMDWMRGDDSRAPYSHQTKTPAHYRDRIFTRVRQAFQKMSYGQFDIAVTVLPEVVRYTKPRSRYTAGGYPFPGLFNGAKDSVEGHPKYGQRYSFGNYDLVYTISPQQAPTGTKGVAWVGAKGAMCNGCEAISENFQIMVAVHELGHNLGLWHASSNSLEYGNVFDWMGNYPDVVGLSYGLGYKLRLGWLPEASVAKVSDQEVSSLNDEYYLMPFDGAVGPVQGQLTGISVDLQKNRRVLFISYRKTPGEGKNGVFLTMQDRDKPNSELVDIACHSPSQQDAALQEGWTYIDPSSQIVVYTQKVETSVATIRLFKVPSASGALNAIRSRKGFSDGAYQCPRVCTDADLLVSLYKGCGMLAQDGYCKGGSITMSGKKLSIGTDLCPKSCNNCAAATSGGSLAQGGGGCADRNVKISGMDCATCAVKGYCDYSTNIGHIGNDLCPKSCGRCPARPTPAQSGGGSDYKNPTPKRTHGVKNPSAGAQQIAPTKQEDKNQAAAEKEAKEEKTADEKDGAANKGGGQSNTCTDDPVWSDADGDGCSVYSDYIKQKKLTQDEACNYGTSGAKIYCRKTCQTCQAHKIADTCEDKMCVSKWRMERGKCFACSEWSNFCNQDFFANDCPRTCGLCEGEGVQTTPPLPTTPQPTTTELSTMPPTEPPTTPPPCSDESCVASWLKDFGKCHKCADYAEDYCGRDEMFMKSCPKSCRICSDDKPACFDDFLPHTCKRYTEWGWCSTAHIAEHCKASCGFCVDMPKAENDMLPTLIPLPGGARRTTQFSVFTFIAACALCAAHLLRL